MRKFLIVLYTFFFVSCTSITGTKTLEPLYSSDENKNNENCGLIIFQRPNAYSGCAAGLEIYVDGVKKETINNGENKKIEVPIGIHSIKVRENIFGQNVERKVEISKNTECVISYNPNIFSFSFSDLISWEINSSNINNNTVKENNEITNNRNMSASEIKNEINNLNMQKQILLRKIDDEQRSISYYKNSQSQTNGGLISSSTGLINNYKAQVANIDLQINMYIRMLNNVQ